MYALFITKNHVAFKFRQFMDSAVIFVLHLVQLLRGTGMVQHNILLVWGCM